VRAATGIRRLITTNGRSSRRTSSRRTSGVRRVTAAGIHGACSGRRCLAPPGKQVNKKGSPAGRPLVDARWRPGWHGEDRVSPVVLRPRFSAALLLAALRLLCHAQHFGRGNPRQIGADDSLCSVRRQVNPSRRITQGGRATPVAAVQHSKPVPPWRYSGWLEARSRTLSTDRVRSRREC
jgi:hypothetical protein